MSFGFRNKSTGLYLGGFRGDTKNPDEAYPKFGDQGSAFCYADERYEGNVEAKCRFKDEYEICDLEGNSNANNKSK